MTVKTQQVCFPVSIHLSPADRFLAAFDVCCGLSGNRFVASPEFDWIWEGYQQETAIFDLLHTEPVQNDSEPAMNNISDRTQTLNPSVINRVL